MCKKILLLFLILALVSCNASKPVVVTKKGVPYNSKRAVSAKKSPSRGKNNTNKETIESTSRSVVTSDVINNYVFDFKDIAMKNMKDYGIPASIILAQGILESGAGRGTLAVNANNHFGIKCHKDWTGASVKHDDDAEQECFRKYNDPRESFKDHAVFLTGRSRYATLFDLPKGDYKAWANGLRAAGYATDPRYPEKLISYIERYHLDQYDSQVLGRKYTPFEHKSIRIASADTSNGAYYEVQKGDTLYSISKKFNLLVAELKEKNNLSENTLAIGQRLIVK